MASEGHSASRGAFILFEGGDRCGKSTQCRLLVEHLKSTGVDVELWNFPDRSTQIGQMINSYLSSSTDLDDAAIHLLFSANRWEKHKKMLAALAAGTTLVVDRYAYSGVAFTAAKNSPGLDLDWCRNPDKGLVAPDVVLHLSMDPAGSASRGGFGEERYEKLEFQKQVQKQFECLRNSSWRVLDAAQSIAEVHAEVKLHADSAVQRAGSGAPLTHLWDDPADTRPLQDIKNKS